ncbi:MAG TPA: hypothetical protein VGN17_19690 [Bryobacteraceae bacterium]|jgi:hypothetical protein
MTITRTVLFASLAMSACALLSAANRPETSTYVEGNVPTLKPNTGGTLVFTDTSAMTFKTGLEEVPVPYAGISRAELGATQVHSHDQPAYKVWSRLHKTETQLLTVNFKNGQGETQTMTFELAKPAANAVLATIEGHTARPSAASNGGATTKMGKESSEAWWGDDVWKTNRNAAKWDDKK